MKAQATLPLTHLPFPVVEFRGDSYSSADSHPGKSLVQGCTTQASLLVILGTPIQGFRLESAGSISYWRNIYLLFLDRRKVCEQALSAPRERGGQCLARPALSCRGASSEASVPCYTS